ncbi:unnamed protein product [Haemonchus placei]|uniref:Uncharacterized protein n=1 Tax=Haemonchus placei TaxID=6290 RepID=A0A3P7Y925_HAEPC|nr:unnamed protein product [Haemonchus placei]
MRLCKTFLTVYRCRRRFDIGESSFCLRFLLKSCWSMR